MVKFNLGELMITMKNGHAHHEFIVAQLLERPTGIWEAMGSIPIGTNYK